MLNSILEFIQDNKKKVIIIICVIVILLIIYSKFHKEDKNVEAVKNSPQEVMDDFSEMQEDYLEEQHEAEGAITEIRY